MSGDHEHESSKDGFLGVFRRMLGGGTSKAPDRAEEDAAAPGDDDEDVLVLGPDLGGTDASTTDRGGSRPVAPEEADRLDDVETGEEASFEGAPKPRSAAGEASEEAAEALDAEEAAGGRRSLPTDDVDLESLVSAVLGRGQGAAASPSDAGHGDADDPRAHRDEDREDEDTGGDVPAPGDEAADWRGAALGATSSEAAPAEESETEGEVGEVAEVQIREIEVMEVAWSEERDAEDDLAGEETGTRHEAGSVTGWPEPGSDWTEEARSEGFGSDRVPSEATADAGGERQHEDSPVGARGDETDADETAASETDASETDASEETAAGETAAGEAGSQWLVSETEEESAGEAGLERPGATSVAWPTAGPEQAEDAAAEAHVAAFFGGEMKTAEAGADEGAGPRAPEAAAGADDGGAGATDAAEAESPIPAGASLSEYEIEELVRRVLHEELEGEIGERLSRNIRRLIRQEIARALRGG